MKSPDYWKNYIYETDPGEIERNLRQATFNSRGLNLSLKYFEKIEMRPTYCLLAALVVIHYSGLI
jgi:hypothetical protein